MFKFSFYAIALASVMSFCTKAYGFDIGTVTAIRDRTDKRLLVINMQLKGVNETDRQTWGISVPDDISQIQAAIVNTLDICIQPNVTVCSETDVKVRWLQPRLPTPQLENEFLSTTQTANTDANGTTATPTTTETVFYDYGIKIEIRDEAADIEPGRKVFFRFFPDKVSNNGSKDGSAEVKLGSGVKSAVDGATVLGTPKSLIVQIPNASSVTFNDNTTGIPGSVLGLLFSKPESGITSFPTTIYTEVPAANPQQSSCTISVAGEEGAQTCSISCATEGLQTIDLATVAAQGIRTSTSTKGSMGFTDVSIADSPYAIILQYTPEGTAQTCVMGEATDAATLIQLSGGQEPKPGDPSCFIATAAYGSALDPRIDVLRWFRDAFLLKTPVGKSVVRFYYQNSPPVADWIRDHEWARTATRTALWIPVVLLESIRDHRILTLSLMLLLSMIFLLRQRRRRLSL